MDWREIIGLKPDKITDENRESIFNTLIGFDDFDRADNKSFKKLFRLSHKILQWKGEEVVRLKDELKKSTAPSKDVPAVEVDTRSVTAENTKLRKLVERLEMDKTQQKVKFRQLTEEIQLLQKRVVPSEREDSPDALSDLEKQEELLSNISMKNKHIKRLLSDLEDLEMKNANLSKDNQFARQQLNEATLSVDSLTVQFKDAQLVIKDQIKLIEELNAKNQSLDDTISAMQREVDERDGEIMAFGKELEKRVLVWKRMLDSKQNELDSLKVRYEDVIDRHPGYNIDAERAELTRLTVSVKERDCLINDLEEKVFEMSNELIRATEVINGLMLKERESKDNSKGDQSADCCSEATVKLARMKKEFTELQENVMSLEEENILKTKQAMEAIDRLSKYENGEEGLPEALSRITDLEQKIRIRDRDIKELVKQINRSQDVARENIALREQVGIDETEIVPTTFVEAKLRKLEKANDRLTLKLRASEEMRLQAKLERNELMKQLRIQEDDYDDSPESDKPLHGRDDGERLRLVQDEWKRKEEKLRSEMERSRENYEIVLSENENLRMGMYEILNNLRSCEGTSDSTPLDSGLLLRLLDVLDADRTGAYEFGPKEALPRQVQELTTIEELPPAVNTKKQTMKISVDEKSSQTHWEIEKTSFGEFEDLLRSLHEVLEENGTLSDELQQLKGKHEELHQRMEMKDEELDQSLEGVVIQSKVDFLLEENDHLHRRLKETEQRHLKILSQVQRKFVELKLSEGINSTKRSPESVDLNSESNLRASLARVVAEFSKNFFEQIPESELWQKVDMDRKLSKVALIEDNLETINFITVSEFNEVVKKADEFKEQVDQLLKRNGILEETLTATAEQLRNQQEAETRNSDEEIALRHLVVDLQSGSEKQLIARAHRDLIVASDTNSRLREENAELSATIKNLQSRIKSLDEKNKVEEESRSQEMKNNSIKYQYLRKTMQLMHERYCQFTPLIEVETFIGLFKRLQQERSKVSESIPKMTIEEQVKKVMNTLKDPSEVDKHQDRIELIRCSTECKLLEMELQKMTRKVHELEEELYENRVAAMKSNQHWMTMKLLLEENVPQSNNENISSVTRNWTDCGVQVELKNVEGSPVKSPVEKNIEVVTSAPVPAPRQELKRESILEMTTGDVETHTKCLESQLKQAMILASSRSALLLETENRLAETQGRMKAMERCMEEKDRALREERNRKSETDSEKRDESVFSITIATLQNLLLEKDTALSRYQELLKTERLEHSKSCEEFQLEIDSAKAQYDELTRKIKERDEMFDDLNRKFSDLAQIRGMPPPPPRKSSPELEREKGVQEDEPELSFNLLDSAKFEEVFVDESKELELVEKQMELQDAAEKLHAAESEIRRLQHQLIEVSKRERGWDEALAERDLEIESLNRKLKQDVGKSLSQCADHNLDEWKTMLEEKDRHIQDLTKTLTHFHDDQQNFLKDTTLSSAEDMARLTSELTRTDATNKVLNTQIEALKRQMSSLEQREKQAREMVKTLKQQLMKRPVISVGKSLQKEDQYQRRIDSLQADLTATREELRKQTSLAEQRRTKGQQEMQLWEKQKRAQQLADKLKLKLAEREQEMEKVKCQLIAARQTVTRMERDKQIMEGKRNSSGHCCASPSCPSSGGGNRRKDCRRPVDTPETDNTEEEDEVNYYGEIVGVTAVPKQWQEANNEVIKALKARIEIQQRKIVAMELEGKGSNVMTQEVEKFQERVANLESQNLRLEAKNLQLQLENDLLRKGDEAERQSRQIKHLEDYVLVLKEELSQAVAVASSVDSMRHMNKGHDSSCGTTKTTANMEQTILALKRIVERLRLENKALKEGKAAVVSSLQVTGSKGPSSTQKLQQELKRVQDLYAEALNKISSNEICKNCRVTGTPRENGTDLKGTLAKLEQKTQLLEKAKVMLSRAAAKEKNLREQIEMWKRKCSELQNVPVIEEISE